MRRKVGRRIIQELTIEDWNSIESVLSGEGVPKKLLDLFTSFRNSNNCPQKVGSIRKGELDLREIQKLNNILYDANVSLKIMSTQESAKAPASDLYKFYKMDYEIEYITARQKQ